MRFGFFVAWLLSALASLALAGFILTVAWHFIAKFW